MTITSRDASILVQVALKAATELASARIRQLPQLDGPNGGVDDTFVTDFATITELLFEKVAAKSEGLPDEAQRNYGGGNRGGGRPAAAPAQNVANAFPGSTDVSGTAAAGPVQVVDEQTGQPVEPSGPLPEWLFAQAAAKGVANVIDFRWKLAQQPKFPWFKSADKKVSFWPPKSAA